MKTVSMSKFRRDAATVLRWLRGGKEVVRLTYRGQPIADLTPVVAAGESRPPATDPFYRLPEWAAGAGGLTNEEIDRTVHG